MTTDDEQPQGHVFSAGGAARATGVSRTTIVRRAVAGEITGAERDDKGQWQIPLAGLIAAGLRPGKPGPPEAPQIDDGDQDQGESAAVTIARLQGEVELERAHRAATERRVQDIERLADERAQRIGELQRMIEPPPNSPEPAPAATETVPEPKPVPEHPTPSHGRLRRIWRTIIN